MMDGRAERLIGRIRALFERTLGENLRGVYVHGSLAFGCFKWETGDIDLIIVVNREPERDQKLEIIAGIMEAEKSGPEKGIELSVLLEADCRNFIHPMPYVMHYSKGHAAAYRADMEGHIARMRGCDRDLAAHLTVMRAVGFPVMGPAVPEMFAQVPPEAYLDSLMYDVGSARTQIHEETVYMVLNLCRVLAWLREGCVLSKEAGGRWGREHLPEDFAPLVEAAMECCRTGGAMPCSDKSASDFAAFMLEAIESAAARMMKG